jgi:hypothetical protein
MLFAEGSLLRAKLYPLCAHFSSLASSSSAMCAQRRKLAMVSGNPAMIYWDHANPCHFLAG